jgi:GAF domain-containing protein
MALGAKFMQIAAIPINESDRLRSLRELKLLDTAAEPQFDAIVNAAALICGTPISLISLIDTNRQWFKANHGLEAATETPRELAFCAHAILSDELLEVTDATQDARFFDNPLVTGSPDIRFYAGVPLTLKDGSQIGTLCVIDSVSKQLTVNQRVTLIELAKIAVHAMEARRLVIEQASNGAQFRALCESSPLGIYATDTHGACTYTNARW